MLLVFVFNLCHKVSNKILIIIIINLPGLNRKNAWLRPCVWKMTTKRATTYYTSFSLHPVCDPLVNNENVCFLKGKLLKKLEISFIPVVNVPKKNSKVTDLWWLSTRPLLYQVTWNRECNVFVKYPFHNMDSKSFGLHLIFKL